jgi:hypothetical protein
MSNYFLTLYRWYTGWSRFHEIEKWKPGWGPTERKWYWLYGLDYLACCLFLAGPVVSVSWYVGKYFNVPGAHFANAGEPLFGSVRSPPWVRIVVPALWALLLWGAV